VVRANEVGVVLMLRRRRPALQVRPYRNGDLADLLRIWNAAYAPYAGYVPRTPAYWEWAIRQRPGVEDEDILVLERQQPLGYGVVGPPGRVLEFAVDPRAKGRSRRVLTSRLVAALEQRARHRGYNAIHFRVPDGDEAQRAVLRSRTYIADRAEHLQWVLMDLVALVETMLQHRRGSIPPDWQHSFHIILERGNYEFAPHGDLLIEVSRETWTVGPADHRNPATGAATVVRMSLPTLADIILQRTELSEALAAGRVTVDPGWATAEVEVLLSLISVRRPWFSPFADYR
jgi:GNAT superfamily N-acetyltransferase